MAEETEFFQKTQFQQDSRNKSTCQKNRL